MRQVFVFDGVAVIVGPWHEPMTPPERGARVELRLLDDEPTRGSASAAERVVIDRPVFRADLFDRLDHPPGNLRSAHFHAGFDGIEPTDRQWDDAVQRDPTGWLTAELSDLRGLLERCRADVAGAEWLDADAAALKDAAPTIIEAVEQAWATARTD